MSEIDDLKKSMNELSANFAKLSAPFETGMSNRIFHNVRLQIYGFFGLIGTFAIVAGYIGFNSFNTVLENAKTNIKAYDEKIQNYDQKLVQTLENINNEGKEKIRNALSEEEVKKLKEEIINETKQRAINEIRELGTSELKKDIAGTLTSPTGLVRNQIDGLERQNLKTAEKEGWAFFGLYKENKWLETKFGTIPTDDSKPKKYISDKTPKKGEKFMAVTDINLRENYATYDPKLKSWNFPKSISVIRYQQMITIENLEKIKSPEGEFYWVQVKPNAK